MGLAKLKQNDILGKAKKLEEALNRKYKRMPEGTFGSKVKYFQEKNNKNQFLIAALWNIVQTRNHIAHKNEFEISLKEYKLFLANFEYIKKNLKLS